MRSYFKIPMLTILVLIASTCLAGMVFADDQSIPVDQFLSQVIELVKSFGGLPWMGKVAGVIMLLIASCKVSFLKPMWAKLGAAQVYVPLVLALIGGIVSMQPITLPGVVAYMFAGAGAVILHELLDSVKAIPGLGSIYVSIINLVESIPLFGSKS